MQAEEEPAPTTTPKSRFGPGSVKFVIAGRDGATGLIVAVNPEGVVGLRPQNPALGKGWCLSPAAAKDLADLLRIVCREPDSFALAAGPEVAPPEAQEVP